MSVQPPNDWERVWAKRSLDPSKGTLLAQLMAADGLDTGYGNVSEESWRAFVRRTAADLALTPGDTVFEVGCGAGAFLYELDALGCAVGGLDRSAALVDAARRAIPRGRFEVGDAASLDATEPADAVVSWGVFLYFPSLPYAARVIEQMAAKARRIVALFDLPDAALREDALAFRRGSLGEAAYNERYRGLDHLYFDRDWTAHALERCGLRDVRIERSQIDGYANAAFRFNIVGVKPPAG